MQHSGIQSLPVVVKQLLYQQVVDTANAEPRVECADCEIEVIRVGHLTHNLRLKLRSIMASRRTPDEALVNACELRREPASLPRVLWVELTSRCPLNCVFCLRRGINGDGRDMDFALYRTL